MSGRSDIGWVCIGFGVVLAIIETYRTSLFAHPVLVRANKYLGEKSVIWRPVALVAIGVLIVAMGW